MSMYTITERGIISMTFRGREAPTASRVDRSPESRPGLLTMLQGGIEAARGCWLDRQLRKAERKQLLTLFAAEEHLLTDIGLCRHDVEVMICALDARRT